VETRWNRYRVPSSRCPPRPAHGSSGAFLPLPLHSAPTFLLPSAQHPEISPRCRTHRSSHPPGSTIFPTCLPDPSRAHYSTYLRVIAHCLSAFSISFGFIALSLGLPIFYVHVTCIRSSLLRFVSPAFPLTLFFRSHFSFFLEK
jgi:hypothetical protein